MMRILPIVLLLLFISLATESRTQWEKAWGGDGSFGIDGNTATDETLDVLYNLEGVREPTRTGGFTTYYVSSEAGGDYPLGSDSNPGTSAAPIKTMEKVETLSEATPCGLEFVFDAYDTWTGTDLESISGIAPSCTTLPNEIAMFYRSSRADVRATIDCNGAGVDERGVFNVTPNVADGGWMVIQGFDITDCNDDYFDGDGDYGKMLIVNAATERVVGSGNQGFTAHDKSTIIAINVSGNSYNPVESSYVAGTVAEAKLMIISDKEFYADDDGNGIGVPIVSLGAGVGLTSYGVFIGMDMTTTPETTGFFSGITSNPSANATLNTIVARVRVHGYFAGYGLRITPQAAGSSTNSIIYQSTFADGYSGIFSDPVDATSFATTTGSCLLFDELDSYIYQDNRDKARSLVDIQYSVYDDDDTTNSWKVNNTVYTNLLGVGGAYEAVSADWPNFFTNSFDSGTLGIDGIQWDGDNDLLTTDDTMPLQSCHASHSCYQSCDNNLHVVLPFSIPEFVLGTRIDKLKIGGTDENIGQR